MWEDWFRMWGDWLSPKPTFTKYEQDIPVTKDMNNKHPWIPEMLDAGVRRHKRQSRIYSPKAVEFV